MNATEKYNINIKSLCLLVRPDIKGPTCIYPLPGTRGNLTTSKNI